MMTKANKRVMMTKGNRPMQTPVPVGDARDYPVALAMLVSGNDPAEVCAITGLPRRIVWTLWDALDGEASGTMRRFGSVIDPRYRPRSEPLELRPSRTRARVHWSAG
jgi:hypothetical protein